MSGDLAEFRQHSRRPTFASSAPLYSHRAYVFMTLTGRKDHINHTISLIIIMCRPLVTLISGLTLHVLRRALFKAVHNQLLAVALPDFAFPAVIRQVLHEFCVFFCQVHAGQVRHEEVCHQYACDTTQCGDDESPLLSEVDLDRRECLCTDSSACLSERCRNSIRGASVYTRQL